MLKTTLWPHCIASYFRHKFFHGHHLPRRNLLSSSAYQGKAGNGRLGLEAISYLPLYTHIDHHGQTRKLVKVRAFETQQDFENSMELMNQVIRQGLTWPFEQEFQSLGDFQGYFTSHAAFVVRQVIQEKRFTERNNVLFNEEGELLGCFYIKPNFPGRCSHICNGGFITTPEYRRMGIGHLMGKMYLRLAKDLGYKSSYFNLVFESNVASVRLWEGLGFERVARLERAARLKGSEEHSVFWDTALGYRFDLESLKEEDVYIESIVISDL